MRRKIIPYNPILKEYARRLRNNMTFGEVLLWNELKRRKMMGFHFNRQRPIDQYIVDFYCKDLMLAIEVDGSSHYSEDARRRDAIRQAKLEKLGVRFLRFDDSEVRNNLTQVVQQIESWVKEHQHNLVGRENQDGKKTNFE